VPQIKGGMCFSPRGKIVSSCELWHGGSDGSALLFTLWSGKCPAQLKTLWQQTVKTVSCETAKRSGLRRNLVGLFKSFSQPQNGSSKFGTPAAVLGTCCHSFVVALICNSSCQAIAKTLPTGDFFHPPTTLGGLGLHQNFWEP
jgi:hypothetical protein